MPLMGAEPLYNPGFSVSEFLVQKTSAQEYAKGKMRSEMITLCLRYPLNRPCSKGELGSLRITPSPPLSTITPFLGALDPCIVHRVQALRKVRPPLFLLNHSSILNFNQFDKFVNARKGKKWGDMIDYPRLRNEFCIHQCDWEHHIP